MKNFISIIAIVFSFTILSCSKENSNTDDTSMEGTWKLVYTTGGITGVSNHFPSGVISWTLNPTTHIVSVVNNNTDDNLIDFLETGNYNYQISSEANEMGCDETFSIDNYADMGCIYIQNGHLIIDQNYTDGMRLEFER